MPGLDSATGTLIVPWWAVLAAVVLLGVFAVLAFLQSGLRQTVGAIARYAVIVVALILAAGAFERFVERERAAERRALDVRIGELTLRTVAHGSPLACLDGIAGEAVETACEKALFASPETIAAAVSYVSARLSLLADMAEPGNGKLLTNNVVLSMRRAVETDRFGFVAHLLSYRDNCTPAVCDAFGLLRDSNRVAANMRERTFDLLVERYAAAWPERGGAKEDPQSSAPSAAAAPVAAAPSVSVPYDFPSAASIPPVSIMNTEPSGPLSATMAEPEKAPPARKPAAAAKRNGQKPGNPVPLTPQAAPAAANTAPGSTIR